jgi:hypothetical protein
MGALVMVKELGICVEAREHVGLLVKQGLHVLHVAFRHSGGFQQRLVRVVIRQPPELAVVELKDRDRGKERGISHLRRRVHGIGEPHRRRQDLGYPSVVNT